MIKRITQLPYYFFTLGATLSVILFFLCYFSKAEGFLILNNYHSLWLDTIFRYFTNLGDGLISIFFGLTLLFFKKRKKAITIFLAYGYSSLLTQIAKRVFDMPRPAYFFKQAHIQYTHFVEGVTVHSHYSFPSGHTASAFAMTMVMVLVFKEKKISIGCLFASLAVGYSRVYLAQHFPIDVFFGALIGVFCALLSYHQVYELKLFRSVKGVKRLKKLKLSAKKTNSI